jgi:hypothetical protein
MIEMPPVFSYARQLENDLPRTTRRLQDLRKLLRVPADRLFVAVRVLFAQRSKQSVTTPVVQSIFAHARILTHTFSRLTFEVPLDSLLSGPACSIFFGFNQQFVRSSLFLDLIFQLRLDTFWETGSFGGGTSLLMAAQTNLPIFSCETIPDFHTYVQAVLRPFGHRVHAYLEDSRAFLSRMVVEQPTARPFIYLDAHWYEDLPLLEELRIIVSTMNEYVIAIDDFRVPFDEGFSYDLYNEQALDWEFIKPTVLTARSTPAVFYPSYSSQHETGFRRGFILLVSDSFASQLSPYVSRGLLSQS